MFVVWKSNGVWGWGKGSPKEEEKTQPVPTQQCHNQHEMSVNLRRQLYRKYISSLGTWESNGMFW